MRRSFLLGVALVTVSATVSSRADAGGPLLHERIPEDPRDDLAMKVTLDGNVPAVIETPGGLVSSPDPHRPVEGAPPRPARLADSPNVGLSGTFKADRDTHRPDLLPYSEPFTPSTAPFKRLAAFDAVNAAFDLMVANPKLRPLAREGTMQAGEDPFYADLVVVPTPGVPFRIPSVGPGAHVLSASLNSGVRDIPFTLWHDSAENWFIDAAETGRLVMEESIPRAAFGGELGDSASLGGPKLPPNVQAEANKVLAVIGIDPTSSRKALAGLVSYFRSFVDSTSPPTGQSSIYLDLALSKKGVCRHRAYAFMITALGLGIPARMIANEAHAWVEVNDGSLWRRIDLGGAGGGLDVGRDASQKGYVAPPDPYPWPPNAEAQSGEELGLREPSTPSSQSGTGTQGSSTDSGSGPRGSSTRGPEGAPSATATNPGSDGESSRDSPRAVIVLEALELDVHRGAPLRLRGEVRSGGQACERVSVEIDLRDVRHGTESPLGALATDSAGKFAGSLVLPESVRTGDYDVVARTSGGPSCGEGSSR